MAYATTLPVLAGLSLLGAAVGVHLGRSAIAEINPAYFSSPETRFHADLAPHRSSDWAQVQAAEYEAAQQVDGLGDGCVNCRDYPEEYYPRHEPAADGYADGWSASAAAEPVEVVFVETAPDPAWQQVERYAGYAVSADEAEPEVVYAPAEEVYAAAD
jgi:hypothetical protein